MRPGNIVSEAGGRVLKSPWLDNCGHLTTTAEGSSKVFFMNLLPSSNQEKKTVLALAWAVTHLNLMFSPLAEERSRPPVWH